VQQFEHLSVSSTGTALSSVIIHRADPADHDQAALL